MYILLIVLTFYLSSETYSGLNLQCIGCFPFNNTRDVERTLAFILSIWKKEVL